eukprot:UN16514
MPTTVSYSAYKSLSFFSHRLRKLP